jgi:hypothetical protein
MWRFRPGAQQRAHRRGSRSIGAGGMTPFPLPFRDPMERLRRVVCSCGGGRRSAACEPPFPFLSLWLDLD